ncbi:MAG: serine/threonine-protein kinase [Chloroflexota bacterium]
MMLAPHKSDTILRERYRVTNIVGQGGMGNVYRAEDLRLPGRLCAIKEVRPDPSLTPDMLAQAQAQFLQEASILAQLDHPTLPKVSDFFSENGLDYLVMDYVPGKDLKEILDEHLANGRLLELDQVLTWANQIVAALNYLHNQSPPVVHRDIKPANIKLTPDNRIKLVDFGLVKVMADDDARTITVVQGRGTALYTPLEQYGGDEGHTDARTDIYALGATFYQLLTGSPPPDAKSRFLNPSSLRPAYVLNPDIPTHISDTLFWAMEMHPDDRPETVEAFYQALLGTEKRPEKEEETPDQLAQAFRANRFAGIFAVILFIIAIILTLL